jgi:hypothetical protein
MMSIMQPLQSVQMPIIKYKEFLCSMLTALLNQYLMLLRHWRINNLRIQRAKNYFCNVLHPFVIGHGIGGKVIPAKMVQLTESQLLE